MHLTVRASRDVHLTVGPVTMLVLSPFFLLYAVIWLYGALVVGAYRGARWLAHKVSAL